MKQHPPECMCAGCRSKRGDIPKHKLGCQCYVCKSKRHEYVGNASPRYGESSWCKGLTKETDERVRDRGNNISKSLKNKKFTDEHKESLRIARNNRPPESDEVRLKRSNTVKLQYKSGKRKPINTIGYHKPDCNCSVCKVIRCEFEDKHSIYMGICFASKEESKIARLRFEVFGIIPIQNINCHMKVNGSHKKIDYYDYGFFSEFHPMVFKYDGDKTREDYCCMRRELLDKNGYQKDPLIHWTSLKEVMGTFKFLSKIKEYL